MLRSNGGSNRVSSEHSELRGGKGGDDISKQFDDTMKHLSPKFVKTWRQHRKTRDGPMLSQQQ